MINYVISFFIPLIYFLLLTATLVFFTKRSFGKCLPIGMMLSAFLLFFSQIMFNTFVIGFATGVLLALLSILIGIIKRKDWLEFKKLYFTSGLTVFLVIYLLVFIFDLRREFAVWDELSHWGMMVKEMFRLDAFYSVDASNLLVHKDYPPIMQLFELFWVKLCGGFNEAFIERAMHTFELSLLVPFVADKIAEKKNTLKSILVAFAMIFVVVFTILFFDGHVVIHTIYVDYVMAIMVVYLLMIIITAKEITWFEVVSLSLGGSFLLLLKQMGLPLYVMTLCLLIGVIWLKNRRRHGAYLKKNTKTILLATIALLIPFVLWFMWGKMVEDTIQQFDLSDLSLGGFINVLFGHGESWQTIAKEKYLAALEQGNITTSYVQLSFAQSVALFIGVLWLVSAVFKEDLDKRKVIMLGGLLVIGAIGYSIVMLMLYTSSFGEIEGPKLMSFDRYMGTYAIIMMLSVVVMVIWQSTNSKNQKILYIVLIVLMVVNAPTAYGRLRPYVHNGQTLYEKYAMVVDELKNEAGVSREESVYIIAQQKGPDKGYHFFTQYYATPIKINYVKQWPVDSSDNAKEYFIDTVASEMREYDYLFVVDFDENFQKRYCGRLGICPLHEGDLYRIIKGDGNLSFEYLTNLETF